MSDSPHSDRALRILPDREPTVRWGAPAPLKQAPSGSTVQLTALRLGPADRDKLYRMGLMETRLARVVHNDHRGRVMLKIQDEIFLLGRRETGRIQARERRVT